LCFICRAKTFRSDLLANSYFSEKTDNTIISQLKRRKHIYRTRSRAGSNLGRSYKLSTATQSNPLRYSSQDSLDLCASDRFRYFTHGTGTRMKTSSAGCPSLCRTSPLRSDSPRSSETPCAASRQSTSHQMRNAWPQLNHSEINSEIAADEPL